MIKAEDLFYGNLKDTMVVEGFETINIIENILNKLSPDIIYTHSYNDTHQDHRNTSYATLSAARRCKKILMYESPTTFEEFKPRFFIDIKSVFERKKELIRIFESQSKKPWWSMGARAALASEGLAYYRGYQSGLDYAEAFELFRFVINGHESILNYP
jgi:LmbE family N-acetylglucosaminyl deacetylase